MTDTVGEAQQAGVDVLMVETGESYEGRPIYVIEVTYDVIKYLIDIFFILAKATTHAVQKVLIDLFVMK